MTPCSYKVGGQHCGNLAVCVILVKQGRLRVENDANETMGRGVGSLYVPVCELHKQNYPDHEGFELEAK